jgi:tol-pal system protein YbgF
MKTARNGWAWAWLAAVSAAVVWASTGAAWAQSSTAKPAKAVAGAEGSGESGLKARVETLEEQLVDMQVVVGTLESLAKNPGSAAPAFPASGAAPTGAPSGDDAARIDGLETQIRALTAQVQQLSDQVRSLGGTPRRSDIPASPDTAQAGPAAGGDGAPGGSSAPGFGSTTVASGGDGIGSLLNNDAPPQTAPPPAPVASSSTTSAPLSPVGPSTQVATAALPTAADAGADPKQLYETAYGYLLQRDYGAAEASFGEFLSKFPNDSLSGNAQYWLGETHFVRGQYKAAASAFLKGYQTYAQSPKAADSLLKLAMSLDRLGQKDAACSSYAELSTRFPSAAASVKARAQTERQRVGCK